MKRIIFILFLCIIYRLPAQVAFHDAKDLLEIYRSNNVNGKFNGSLNTVSDILSKYTESSGLTNREVLRAYESNPFLKDYLPAQVNFADIEEAGDKSPFGFLKNIGETNVTKYADGLSRFLVERAQEELNVAFFRKFRKRLMDEEEKELGIMFPQTLMTMQVVGEEVYQYETYLQTLRESFLEDLSQLPLNGEQLLIKSSADTSLVLHSLISQNPELGVVVKKLLETSHQFQLNDTPLPFIIEYLANSEWKLGELAFGKPQDVFKFIHHFSYSLLAEDSVTANFAGIAFMPRPKLINPEIWVPFQDLFDLSRTPEGLDFYFGLLYQSGAAVRFSDGSNMQSLLNKNNRLALVDALRAFVKHGNTANQALKAIKNKDAADSGEDLSIWVLGNEFISLIEQGYAMKAALGSPLSQNEKSTLYLLDLTFDLSTHIQQKQFGSAVTQMAAIIDTLSEGKAANAFKASFLKYGHFMASAIEADDAEEIQAAIEANALPVGSSSIKKYSSFNIALQAYVGGFYGNESLSSANGDREKDVFGISAPIGINTSFGFKKGGAISIFGSLVDIGAFTAFRLKDQDSDDLPELKLKNIFSPGVFLIYGLPEVPISLGVGYQRGPNLREVNPDAFGLEESSGERLSIILGVDIPVFNFFTSQ